MTKSKKLIYSTFKLTDLFALFSALILLTFFQNYFLEGRAAYSDFLNMRISLFNMVLLIVVCIIYLIVFEKFSLYTTKLMPYFFTLNFIAISKAVFFFTLLFFSIGNLLNISVFSGWSVLTIFMPSCIIFSLLLRAMAWQILSKLHLGDRNNRSVLILGNGKRAHYYAQRINDSADFGYQLVGFLCDDEFKDDNKDILGNFSNFTQVLTDNVIDEIIVCTNTATEDKDFEAIILRAYAQGICLRFPLTPIIQSLFKNSDMTRLTYENAIISPKGEISPEMTVHSGYQIGGAFLVKRLIDLTLSTLALILLLPLFIIVAVAIIFDSKGSPLFIQERYGYNSRVFKLFKFRTMVAGADAMQDELRATQNELDGAAFKIKNDPRVTRLGQFLRKTSIDELPQLLNVIRGEMSLVGPRPLPLADYKEFTNVNHLRRLSVLPGVTGSWQVDGRNNLSFEEWMQLDSEYVDNWSHWLDFKILLKTIPAVLKGKGAS